MVTVVGEIPLGTAHLPQDRVVAARDPRTLTPDLRVGVVEEALRWLPGSGETPPAPPPASPINPLPHVLLADDSELSPS